MIVSFSQDKQSYTDTLILSSGEILIGSFVTEDVTTYKFLISNTKKITSYPKGEVKRVVKSNDNTKTIKANEVEISVEFPINSNGEIEYTEVVFVDSTSSDNLYSRAKMCIAESFKSAKDVVQNDDAFTKQILIKGNIKADYSWNPLAVCPGFINFTMTVFCKDNRYKYSVKPENHLFGIGCKVSGTGGGSLLNEKPSCGTFNMPKSYWIDIKSKANKEFRVFIEKFKKEMQVDKSNDW